MATFNFELSTLPPEAEALRDEVRTFLKTEMAQYRPAERARSWGGFNRDFSRRMGERGWIGMTWPKKYGGHERTALERYVVLEETLAAGAPVSAHWVADRQSGPLLLRFGTEEQRQRFLPSIARGELAFAIGMSEPDSGSDLASVRTRAEKVAGGYKVNGTKIWTSNAHLSDYAIALFRTKVVPDKKHEGLSQFLVDLKSPGISIRPIIDLAGGHHFNEVHFQDCLVPDDMLVGKDGEGWKQVTTELGLRAERPRALPLLAPARDRADPRGGERAARAGRRADRPLHRAPGDAAPDVALDRHHAPGRAEPEPGGRGDEGHRHHVRAGDPGGGARADRRRAAHRQRHRVREDARLPGRSTRRRSRCAAARAKSFEASSRAAWAEIGDPP